MTVRAFVLFFLLRNAVDWRASRASRGAAWFTHCLFLVLLNPCVWPFVTLSLMQVIDGGSEPPPPPAPKWRRYLGVGLAVLLAISMASISSTRDFDIETGDSW
jgi:hypothetical protein